MGDSRVDKFDIERYAAFIAGDPKAITEYDQAVAKVVLEAVDGDLRLLPRGGVLRTEYGLTVIENDGLPGKWERIAVIGTSEFARKHGTHKRTVCTWPSYSPNDHWAQYITAWEPVER
jgi:hypothetical protein